MNNTDTNFGVATDYCALCGRWETVSYECVCLRCTNKSGEVAETAPQDSSFDAAAAVQVLEEKMCEVIALSDSITELKDSSFMESVVEHAVSTEDKEAVNLALSRLATTVSVLYDSATSDCQSMTIMDVEVVEAGAEGLPDPTTVPMEITSDMAQVEANVLAWTLPEAGKSASESMEGKQPAIGWYTLVDKEAYLDHIECNTAILEGSVTDVLGNIHIDRLSYVGGGWSGEKYTIAPSEWKWLKPADRSKVIKKILLKDEEGFLAYSGENQCVLDRYAKDGVIELDGAAVDGCGWVGDALIINSEEWKYFEVIETQEATKPTKMSVTLKQASKVKYSHNSNRPKCGKYLLDNPEDFRRAGEFNDELVDSVISPAGEVWIDRVSEDLVGYAGETAVVQKDEWQYFVICSI